MRAGRLGLTFFDLSRFPSASTTKNLGGGLLIFRIMSVMVDRLIGFFVFFARGGGGSSFLNLNWLFCGFFCARGCGSSFEFEFGFFYLNEGVFSSLMIVSLFRR
jgi:hypothetical protein